MNLYVIIKNSNFVVKEGDTIKTLKPVLTKEIYYGASDTVECLATARIEDLIDLCTDSRK